MNDARPEPVSPNADGFDSRNCINVLFDGPGDNTIRPMSPERREQVLKEREKERELLAKWEAFLKQSPPFDEPPPEK